MTRKHCRGALTKTSRPGWMLSLVMAMGVAGCATHEQTGALVGGGIGLAACEFAYRNDPARKKNTCRVVAGAVSAFAGSRIGAMLDERDRRLAEEASRRALAEREAAVQREINARNAEIERRQSAELAAARSAAQRAEAERRARRARQAAPEQAQEQIGAGRSTAATWRSPNGNSGSAQAVGPVAVAGREGCQQVREVAYIQGKEVRQQATYCPRAGGGGGLERVAA